MRVLAHTCADRCHWQNILEKEVGTVVVIQGTLDGIQYTIWSMKDVGYTMKMIAIGGNLFTDDLYRTTIHEWMGSRVEEVKEFIYPLPLDLPLLYQHAVDDHNNLCCSLPSWEDTWVTQQRELSCIFMFDCSSIMNLYLEFGMLWVILRCLRYSYFDRNMVGNLSSTQSLRMKSWHLMRYH